MNSLNRIRNWPWPYIGRRAAVRGIIVVGIIPYGLAMFGWMVAAGIVYPAFMAFIGKSWMDATERAVDSTVADWLFETPGRLRDWAEEARQADHEKEGLRALVEQILTQQGVALAYHVAQFPAVGRTLLAAPSAPDPDPIPDDPNPVLIRGWRTYSVDATGALKGATGASWDGATMAATCRGVWLSENGTDAGEHLREGRCTCGIYVLKDAPEMTPMGEVLAEVVGWGAYIEYERGWRCQHVRIERLLIGDLAATLRARYGCPVELQPLKEMEPEPDDGAFRRWLAASITVTSPSPPTPPLNTHRPSPDIHERTG